MVISELEHGAIETPVADRPLIRELAGWPVFLAGGGRVVSLQGSHPTVVKGLEDHSRLRTDPLGRGTGTFEFAQRILFGSDRPGTAAEIRELHRNIKGTGFDGKPYHAWNRDSWTWVHYTTLDAMLYGIRAIHGDPPLERQQALLELFNEVGSMYGVRAQDMPKDIAGFHAYIRDGVENKCTHVPDDTIAELLQAMPRPQRLPIPDPLWRGALGAVGRSSADAGRSGRSRRRCGRGGASDGARCTRPPTSLSWSRSEPLTASLPDRLRMTPDGYRALHQPAA